jgi:hypothetical protein
MRLDFRKVEDFKALSLLMIYRLLLKNMKFYPSKNRFDLLTTIQEEFHEKKNLKDEKQLKEEKIKA